MGGFLTIAIIFIIAYLIALGLEGKWKKKFFDERQLRLEDKEQFKLREDMYELELMKALKGDLR